MWLIIHSRTFVLAVLGPLAENPPGEHSPKQSEREGYLYIDPPIDVPRAINVVKSHNKDYSQSV